MRRRLLGSQRQSLFHKRLGVLQPEGQSAHAIRAGLISSIDQKADLRKVRSGNANSIDGVYWSTRLLDTRAVTAGYRFSEGV
jgi:hypothetical protein